VPLFSFPPQSLFFSCGSATTPFCLATSSPPPPLLLPPIKKLDSPPAVTPGTGPVQNSLLAFFSFLKCENSLLFLPLPFTRTIERVTIPLSPLSLILCVDTDCCCYDWKAPPFPSFPLLFFFQRKKFIFVFLFPTQCEWMLSPSSIFPLPPPPG